MTVETYAQYTKEELGISDDDWKALIEYVNSIKGALREEATDVGGVEEVEESPPSISDETFDPGGWVGLYPGNVTVVPSHISEDEYQALLSETQRWVEIIGATTIETTLPLSSDILIDARARLAAYSKALIELTETVQSHRLPVEVQRPRRRGFEPEGRPMFQETIREAARGSQQVVSEEIRFSFDTLLNHLLVRFHVELLTEMHDLADRYPYYKSAFSSQIDYHRDFIDSGIPSRLVEEAIKTDLTSPAVIAEARRESTDEMAEVVDLWEAFQRDIGMELSLSNKLNTAVKPISKLYELWCLGILLDVLKEITGYEPEISSIEKEYRFGNDLRLYYNRPLRTHSRYLRDNLNVGPGQPDFALEIGGKIVWIGDAKFKTDMRLSDYQRFITYLIDLLPPQNESMIFYVEDDPTGRSMIRDYPINHISLRPDNRNQATKIIREALQAILEIDGV